MSGHGYVVVHPRDVKPGDLVDVYPVGEPIPCPPPAFYARLRLPARRELVDARHVVDIRCD